MRCRSTRPTRKSARCRTLSCSSTRCTTCAARWRPCSAARWAWATRMKVRRCAGASARSGPRLIPRCPALPSACRKRGQAPFLDTAPAEPFVLAGDTDPLILAAHRARERGAGERRTVVLLRKMRADDVLQARAVERAEQGLGVEVVEVAEGAGDALLQPAGIGAGPQHVAVVVALEHQRVE